MFTNLFTQIVNTVNSCVPFHLISRMSSTGLPKNIMSPPSFIDEKPETTSVQNTYRASRYFEYIRGIATQGVQDMHQNRIKNLRKELDYLKQTEWKYEPIDKYIGQ